MILNFAPVANTTGIYRGGQPQDFVDWQFLRSSGVTQVLKLNLDTEGSDEGALGQGLQLFKVPISNLQQVLIAPSRQDLIDAVGFITPNTFVHCEHGQDRTGLVIALYRIWVQKWPKKQAQAEMLKFGFHQILLGLWRSWEEAKEDAYRFV